MRCVICEVGETLPGSAAATLEGETTTLVFKFVPREFRANCGEARATEEVSRQILAAAELAIRSGVRLMSRSSCGLRRREIRLGAGGTGSPT